MYVYSILTHTDERMHNEDSTGLTLQAGGIFIVACRELKKI